MYKDAHGEWRHDFRVAGLPRFHASYGAVKRDTANRHHETLSQLFRSRQRDVIEALKAGSVTMEQLTELRESHQPFSVALSSQQQPWPTLLDAGERYVESFRQNVNKADGTTKAAEAHLAMCLAHLDTSLRLDAIKVEHTRVCQVALFARGLSDNSVTSAMHRLAAMFRWFIQEESVAAREEKRPTRTLWVPIDDKAISKKRPSRDRYLKDFEVEQVVALLPPQMRFPVAAGLLAGLRIDEVCHLRPHVDVVVDGDEQAVHVQTQRHWKPKTPRSVRTVPMGPEMVELARHHIAHFASEEWMLPATMDPTLPLRTERLRERFKVIVEASELVWGTKDPDGVTFHTLRHSFASHLLMSESDIFTVAKLMGVTVKRVEDTYGHLSQDHSRAALARLVHALPTLSQFHAGIQQ